MCFECECGQVFEGNETELYNQISPHYRTHHPELYAKILLKYEKQINQSKTDVEIAVEQLLDAGLIETFEKDGETYYREK